MRQQERLLILTRIQKLSATKNLRSLSHTGMDSYLISRLIHQVMSSIQWSIHGTHITVSWHLSGQGLHHLHTVDSETDTDIVIQSRIFRVLYTLHLRWLLKRSDSCSQHRLIMVEDFRLSSLHTIRDMRILLTMLPMYRRQDIRLTELMMHYGFSLLYTNMYQRQEM